jgi:hypothetical protein
MADLRARPNGGLDVLTALCPQPPLWNVNWDAAVSVFPALSALDGCEQDPHHHAEGDVAIHTRMACAALSDLPEWRALPVDERVLVFTAVLLHDVAKPECTKRDIDGRITARGHSSLGERSARRLLWQLDVPVAWRDHIAHLIRHHQVPFWALERPDLEPLILGTRRS